uniref:hypothetical protein n=1 Tax=Amycolatopsis sp. CA-096443 TaxID=3239919 RepID=UPI003F490734
MGKRPSPRAPVALRGEWAALAVTGGSAIALWQLLGSVWPWLLALGVLGVAAMIGLRRPGALAVGLAAADVWWLAAVPLWGWALAGGAAAVAAGLWWVRALRRNRSGPLAAGTRLPAARAAAEGALPAAEGDGTARVRDRGLPLPGLGQPVRRWHAAAALAAGAALLAVGAVGWRADAAATAARQQAELDQAHAAAFPMILPRSGADLVHYLVGAIAQHRPEHACFAFLPEAGRDFARAFGAASCEAAIDRLSRQLPGGPRAGIAYENATGAMPLDGSATTDLGGGRKIVNACQVNVSPPTAGPGRLGIFTMQQVDGAGSQVTAYSPCL